MAAGMDIDRKSKSKKAPKDPNAPKRPLSSYMLWVGDTRGKIKEENPEASITDIAKMLGKLWSNVGSDERQSYKRKADDMKAKYQKRLDKYRESAFYLDHLEERWKHKIQQTKAPFRKDENAPKRPLSDYMLYVMEVREQFKVDNPSLSMTEITAKIAKAWKSLSSDEQAPFRVKAKDRKAEYKKKMEKYKKTKKYKDWAAAKEEYQTNMKEKRAKLTRQMERELAKARGEEPPKLKKKGAKKKTKKSASKKAAPAVPESDDEEESEEPEGSETDSDMSRSRSRSQTPAPRKSRKPNKRGRTTRRAKSKSRRKKKDKKSSSSKKRKRPNAVRKKKKTSAGRRAAVKRVAVKKRRKSLGSKKKKR